MEAELSRAGESPIRTDIHMKSTLEYSSQRQSTSHISRSNERRSRKNSGHEYDRNHRSESEGNHRSRSGSREGKYILATF